MKKILYIVILMYSQQILLAQITLTANDFAHINGQNFPMKYGLYANPGASGSNITWDFSFLTPVSPYTLQTFDASNSPNGSSFPTSTYGTHDLLYATSRFYSLNSGGLFFDGSVNQTVFITHSNNEKIFSFPFTYNNTYSDSYSGTYPYYPLPNLVYRRGVVTVTGDAYGNLIMPYGTISNVLRVKTVETYTDSNTYAGTVIQFTNTIYDWYKNGLRIPVLEIINGTAIGTETRYVDGSVLTSITGLLSSSEISLFPIPCENKLYINGLKNTDIKVEIVDIYGKKILSFNQLSSAIDISTISSGIYFIIVHLNDKKEVLKFIKQ